MTIYSSNVQPLAAGQQISGDFGKQSSGSAPANPIITAPPAMPLIEAMSRGVLPRNSLITAVSGVSTGAQNPTPIADLCSNGAGNQMNLGVAIAGVAGNPVSNGANDNQQFVDGTSAIAQTSNGPTPTGTETLTSAPVSVNTSAGNVTFSGYAG